MSLVWPLSVPSRMLSTRPKIYGVLTLPSTFGMSMHLLDALAWLPGPFDSATYPLTFNTLSCLRAIYSAWWMPATELTAGGALGGLHFVHLHGVACLDVVRVVGHSAYNYVDPVKRDTVSLDLQANGERDILLHHQQPGPLVFPLANSSFLVEYQYPFDYMPILYASHNDWHVPPPQMMTHSGHVSCLAACLNL
ncbi:hypothetical protein V8B97DRAFT_2111888 [Scleroderma yunnanense]